MHNILNSMLLQSMRLLHNGIFSISVVSSTAKYQRVPISRLQYCTSYKIFTHHNNLVYVFCLFIYLFVWVSVNKSAYPFQEASPPISSLVVYISTRTYLWSWEPFGTLPCSLWHHR